MEKYLSRKVIYNGKILRLELDQVECNNGKLAYREIVRHPGGAAILCISNEEDVLLIKQFRYAYNEIIYEIPAGKLEPNENPLQAAEREFEEETGNKAVGMTYLTTIYPTVGYTDEKIYIYYVDNFVKSQTHFDEDEFIEPIWVKLSEVLQMIQQGVIRDAKTICAIQLYLLNQKKCKF